MSITLYQLDYKIQRLNSLGSCCTAELSIKAQLKKSFPFCVTTLMSRDTFIKLPRLNGEECLRIHSEQAAYTVLVLAVYLKAAAHELQEVKFVFFSVPLMTRKHGIELWVQAVVSVCVRVCT